MDAGLVWIEDVHENGSPMVVFSRSDVPQIKIVVEIPLEWY